MIWKVKKRFLLNGNVITLISSLQFAARWIYFFTKSTNQIRWNSLFEIKIWKIQKIIFRLGQLGILKCFVICLVLWAFIYPYCILSVWYNLDLKLVQKCIANVFLSIYKFFFTIIWNYTFNHSIYLSYATQCISSPKSLYRYCNSILNWNCMSHTCIIYLQIRT